MLKNNDNIMISLKSITLQGNERNETELLTKAYYDKKNNTHIFSYEDTSATGFEGSTTTITVNGNNTASVVRTGTANSNLTLETNKKHYCHYGTPYGDFHIGVMTQLIDNKLEDYGSLALKYTLDINSSYLSDNEIIITIQNFSKT